MYVRYPPAMLCLMEYANVEFTKAGAMASMEVLTSSDMLLVTPKIISEIMCRISEIATRTMMMLNEPAVGEMLFTITAVAAEKKEMHISSKPMLSDKRKHTECKPIQRPQRYHRRVDYPKPKAILAHVHPARKVIKNGEECECRRQKRH